MVSTRSRRRSPDLKATEAEAAQLECHSCPLCCGKLFTIGAALQPSTLSIIKGISSALLILLDRICEKGANSLLLFDESTLPYLHIASFCLTHDSTRRIRMFGIQIFLEHLASMLEIDARELVLAYMIVERLVCKDKRLLQNNTVRLVFVAAVSLVMKLVVDAEWLTTNTFGSIQDFVMGIDCLELAQMEWKLLKILDYSLPVGAPEIRDSCIIYTVNLMAEAGVVMNEGQAAQLLEEDGRGSVRKLLEKLDLVCRNLIARNWVFGGDNDDTVFRYSPRIEDTKLIDEFVFGTSPISKYTHI